MQIKIDKLESLLCLAERRGISHGELDRVRSQAQPIFEGNRLKQLESSQSVGTALRLWQNNRLGLAVAYGNIEPKLPKSSFTAWHNCHPIGLNFF